MVKNYILFLVYVAFFAFLSNAQNCLLEVDVIPFYGNNYLLTSSSEDCLSDNSSDSKKADHTFIAEEVESKEEHDGNHLTPCCSSFTNFSRLNLSANYFLDFAKTALPFIQETALYIRYHSLKINFLTV